MEMFPGPFRHLASEVLSDLVTAVLVPARRRRDLPSSGPHLGCPVRRPLIGGCCCCVRSAQDVKADWFSQADVAMRWAFPSKTEKRETGFMRFG